MQITSLQTKLSDKFSLEKQRRQLRNRYDLLIIYVECRGYKAGGSENRKKKPPTRIKYKFSVVLQMAFGHQMQMTSLQLAKLQLPCPKNLPTVRYYLVSIPFLLHDLKENPKYKQKNIMGKGTAAVTLVKPLQVVVSLNSIYL